MHTIKKHREELLRWYTIRYDTIRYDTADLRALKSWRDGQLNLAHGPETKNNEKIKIKNRVAQNKRCRQKSVEAIVPTFPWTPCSPHNIAYYRVDLEHVDWGDFQDQSALAPKASREFLGFQENLLLFAQKTEAWTRIWYRLRRPGSIV